jgi:hypothetical protein
MGGRRKLEEEEEKMGRAQLPTSACVMCAARPLEAALSDIQEVPFLREKNAKTYPCHVKNYEMEGEAYRGEGSIKLHPLFQIIRCFEYFIFMAIWIPKERE